MSYAVVEDVPASWERYRSVADAVPRETPGLLLHIAGPTDEGFRIIELWESEEAWQASAADIRAILEAVDPDIRPRTVIRDLHPVRVVLGGASAQLVEQADADSGVGFERLVEAMDSGALTDHPHLVPIGSDSESTAGHTEQPRTDLTEEESPWQQERTPTS